MRHDRSEVSCSMSASAQQPLVLAAQIVTSYLEAYSVDIPRLGENLELRSLQDRRGLIRSAHERRIPRPLGPGASAGDDAPADAEYGAPADERCLWHGRDTDRGLSRSTPQEVGAPCRCCVPH